MNAIFPVGDRHPIMSGGRGPLNDHVRHPLLLESLRSGFGRAEIIDVELGVRARPCPLSPRRLVTRVVQAVEAPALSNARRVLPRSPGHCQLSHRQPATRMAGEDNAPDGGRRAPAVRAEVPKSRHHLTQVAVESTGSRQTARLRARAQSRRDEDHILSAVVHSLAERPIGETAAVPISINGSFRERKFVPMQIQDEVDLSLRLVAGGDEDARHRPRRALAP